MNQHYYIRDLPAAEAGEVKIFSCGNQARSLRGEALSHRI